MENVKLNEIKLGTIYYRYEGEKRLEYRILCLIKDKVFVETKEKKHLVKTMDTLENQYTRLNPDYCISFYSNDETIFIWASTKNDLLHKTKPFFAVGIDKAKDYVSVMNTSDVDKTIKSENIINIGGYIMDTTYKLVKHIPTLFLIQNKIKSKTLVSVLKDMCISEYIDSIFGIKHFDGMIENESLGNEQLDTLQRCTTKYMNDISIIKYDKDIVLTKIKVDYDIIRDNYCNLYLVTYIANGFYTPCADCLEEKEIEAILGHTLK